MNRYGIFWACLALALPSAPGAATFRWSSQGEISTLDPHAFNESFNAQQNSLVYDWLVHRDKEYRIIPALAVSWRNIAPTRWIVHLRRNVRFHDGTPFTADDVVFSFARASVAESGFRAFALQAGIPTRIDDHTVEFETPVPNPLFAEAMGSIMIMSKVWSQRHRSTRPQDFRAKEQTYASRHAMGTGPYILVSHEPGVKTVHRRNSDWWGIKEGHFDGNVDLVEYRPIANSATRMAALRSGEIDFVLDPPVHEIPAIREDKSLRLWIGDEIRVIFIGFDQSRDQLLYADVKGRNPFKDVRVRRALQHAVDIEAIRSQVMRGLSRPTGLTLHDPAGAGVPATLDNRLPYDLPAARRLLAEAGYPSGFGLTLHCPNDRYINDEKICLALAAMWARIGVRTRVESMTKAQYFQKVLKRDTSAFMFGWGGGSSDPIFLMKQALHSRDGKGSGDLNLGDFRNERLDALIDAFEGEMDLEKRSAMVTEAVRIVRDEALTLPLHRQLITWVSRRNVSVVVRPNNALVPMWVRVD